MSDTDKKKSGKPKVSRGLFLGLTLTLTIILIVVLILMIVFYRAWRTTLAELENNICPVIPGT